MASKDWFIQTFFMELKRVVDFPEELKVVFSYSADKLDQLLDSDSVDQYWCIIASIKENLFIVSFIESNFFTYDDSGPSISMVSFHLL